jgi:hypothetical protein
MDRALAPMTVSGRPAEVLRDARRLGGTAWAAASVDVPGVAVQYASKPALIATPAEGLWSGGA